MAKEKSKPLSEQLRLFLIEKQLDTSMGYGFLWSLVGHLMAIEDKERRFIKKHKKGEGNSSNG